MKLFKRRPRTVDENVERYVNLLRQGTDDLVFPVDKFYKECSGENGEADAEDVIIKLQQQNYEVRIVERYGYLWNSMYVVISRWFFSVPPLLIAVAGFFLVLRNFQALLLKTLSHFIKKHKKIFLSIDNNKNMRYNNTVWNLALKLNVATP